MRCLLVKNARYLLKVRVLEEFFLYVVEFFVKGEELTSGFHHFLWHVLTLSFILLNEGDWTQVLLDFKRAFGSIILLSLVSR